jgi:hypothetical protein
MNDNIIIGFVCDDRIYELPKSIIKNYPNSILSLYDDVETNDKIIITDMTYNQFQIIYSVIMGQQKQWLVPPEILKYMDKYGLINDTLLTLHNNINEKLNKKCLKIENFINNGQMLLTKNINQYNEYKKLFEHDKNIMSVQITYESNDLICINILESIPIYYLEKSNFNNMIINDEMDINLMRYNMIGIPNCEDCKICDECCNKTSIKLNCENCKICSSDKHYMRYDDDGYWNKTIYSTDMSEYFWELKRVLTSEYTFKKTKCENTNMIKLSNITNSRFTENINLSLKKIVEFIINNDQTIIEYHEIQKSKSYYDIVDSVIGCCNGPIHIPTSRYDCFINLTTIL